MSRYRIKKKEITHNNGDVDYEYEIYRHRRIFNLFDIDTPVYYKVFDGDVFDDNFEKYHRSIYYNNDKSTRWSTNDLEDLKKFCDYLNENDDSRNIEIGKIDWRYGLVFCFRKDSFIYNKLYAWNTDIDVIKKEYDDHIALRNGMEIKEEKEVWLE